MFNFKNKYSPNEPSTYRNRSIPGLSKYWRYSTLDAQNNENFNIKNNYSSNNIQNINPINYSNQNNFTSPDDITLEISYDNFYTLGVDMMKKKKYAEELKKQIEEKQMRKKIENQKKKLDDLNDEIRIEKERKILEDRQKENNKRILPKINIAPYYPYPMAKNQNPIKIYTPAPPPPPIPLLSQNKAPSKPKINTHLIKNYNNDLPTIKYVYRKIYNNEETKNYLKEREQNLEKYDKEMKEQLEFLKKDFNKGMKKLNDEVNRLNSGIGNKNHNFRYLLNQKINEINADIRNNSNNKTINNQTKHIYNIIRKIKDGKAIIQRFISDSDYDNIPFIGNNYYIKTPKSYINDNNFFDELITNNSFKLPYINLSHCISYS